MRDLGRRTKLKEKKRNNLRLKKILQREVNFFILRSSVLTELLKSCTNLIMVSKGSRIIKKKKILIFTK